MSKAPREPLDSDNPTDAELIYSFMQPSLHIIARESGERIALLWMDFNDDAFTDDMLAAALSVARRHGHTELVLSIIKALRIDPAASMGEDDEE